MKNLSWKPVLALSVIVIAFLFVFPTIHMMANGKDKPVIWPYKAINLGLDLQGGMHLVLEVETEKAVEITIERISQELRGLLKEEHIRHRGIKKESADKIAVLIKGDANLQKFEDLLDKEYKNLRIKKESADGEMTRCILDLPDTEAKNIKKMATEQALETIRNRIDQFGVSEPDIRIQGERRILIQLPGVKETERAKDLIKNTAQLEFKLVDDVNDLDAAIKGSPPLGSEILYQVEKNKETNRTSRTPYLIRKRTLLTGSSLTDARVQIDAQYNEPYVSIEFDKKGARDFERITGDNIKKRLAIILDNKVYSAPVIQDRIGGGSARITGNFSTEEAHDLAIVLRAGAMPAPVKIIEDRTVGPSLGKDSITQGLISMLVGGILVILFMIIYYRSSGLIADLALVLNIILIAGGLAAFQATLTLPGIAGIILTIGMAVDANVLIFERIREELNLGRTPRAAVAAGFEKATLTILDANVTTFIAAIILFQFGTGAVKGFAVTLCLGIVSSLFTALVLSRLIFDFLLDRKINVSANFMQVVKTGINISFINNRKKTFFLSSVIILASITSLLMHKGPKYGIDFAGGTLMQVKFLEPTDIKEIKNGLVGIDMDKSTVQQFGEEGDNEYLIRTKKSIETSDGFAGEVKSALKSSTGKDVEIRRIEMVGPQVGEDLREKALMAMFYALLFITIYISGRFELKWGLSGVMAGALMSAVYFLSIFNVSIPFLIIAALVVTLVLFWFLELKYAMGAIVALIHDISITVGVFSIMDIEFTLPIIAALLTIIGYSLNDTIIVYDRIRENLKKQHKKPLDVIINKSINETLSRTILTSITTLVVVISLYVLGGSIIHDFAFAMMIGVIIGTYSSIFIASPILLAWQTRGK
ncbi:MAG: protein translocase subunit SecD [Desulfobacterales bacterium]|nr:protein translocase subunit SecD [Desulfobacterales bacterium]